MFTSGLGNIATAAFTLTTMAIAVPTGVKIFNWIGTIHKGQLIMSTPMLFALGFIFQFMVGGFSGLMHANAVHDLQQHDTYFIVAHFHYVLIGGALFGTFAGIYYWFPKVTGRKLNESFGKAMFWFLFIGFNLTFFPMHWLGLNGMPRRIYTYAARNDWGDINFICTCGAALMSIAVIIFFIDLARTAIGGEASGDDPWDARTTEWSIPSPPPVYNFKETPHVKTLDDFWYAKYPESLHMGDHDDDDDAESPYADDTSMHPSDVVEHDHHDEHGIHMPGGSWFPMFAALGFCVGGFGIIMHGEFGGYTQEYLAEYDVPYLQVLFREFWLAIVGGIAGVFSIFAWAMEPIGGYYIHFDDDNAPDKGGKEKAVTAAETVSSAAKDKSADVASEAGSESGESSSKKDKGSKGSKGSKGKGSKGKGSKGSKTEESEEK